MDTAGPNATFVHCRSIRCERRRGIASASKCVADADMLLGKAVLPVRRLGERPRLGFSIPAKREGDIDFSPAFCARLA